jgi:hypothetical protein
MFLQMANPDYATLLPQIARETDAVKKQALIDECYQFNEPLTLEEKSLFSYFTPDGIEDNDYIIDNPGLIQGNLFVSYIGDYYNRYAQSTTTEDDNTFGGPFYIYGTGKTGFGSGQLGFFYPLYTDANEIPGSYHIHTFEEYEGYTFYMPDSEMYHAVATAPSDLYEYGDFDVTLEGAEAPAPIIVIEYTPPVEEEEEEEVVTTTQTIAVAAPSTDGTTNNYGNITGLTITRATTTSSSSSTISLTITSTISPGGYVSVGSSSSNTFVANDLYNTSDGENGANIYVTVTGSSGSRNFTVQSSQSSLPIGSGSYTITNASGGKNLRLRYYYTNTTSTTTTTYSFTNNTGYSATIEGTTLANGAGPTEITISGDVDVTYTSES